jgi:UDP-N-acetylmuramoyl-L-alanyl-D-glutamate--2,6-diaminopimelate ligase
LVGITGTNGKTTTCYLTEAILRAAGLKTALITTVETRIGENIFPSSRTTPEPIQLQRLLREAEEQGVSHAVLEVSSHGIALSRTLGCEFDVVALTNVTQDHLDFHPSFEDYFETKLRLFKEYARETAKETIGVVNLDEPNSKAVMERAECPVVTCGIAPSANLSLVGEMGQADGTRVILETAEGRQELTFPLYGGFNSTNAVLAAGIARALNIPWETISLGMTRAKAPPGRLERVDEGQPFLVFVDYAHTPDSLRRAIEAISSFCRGRVIVVFGCGGDRDKGKRPLMGEIAASRAELAIVTSDNPRSEDPEQIIAQITSGMSGHSPIVEPDRDKAIRLALGEASEGDVVLIAGKGHETYQIFKDRTIHFSDQEVARKWLRELLRAGTST